MTPEQYDEIRKKKMSEGLSNNSLDPAMVADLAASAGPSLLALLGGASPAVVSGLLDKGNQYAMKRGAQEEVTKDKIAIIEEDGLPKNVLVRDSLGKKPYYQQKAASALGGSSDQNVQSKMVFSNKKTGELLSTYLARNGKMYRVGETPDMAEALDPNKLNQEYVPFIGFGTAKSKDMYGGESVTQFQKTLPSKKVVVGGTQGYAGTQGVPTEGLKATEKSLDEHNKRIGDLELKANTIDDFISVLSNPNANANEIAAAQEAVIRATTTEPRLTDEDVKRAMGDNFKSVFTQLSRALSNKVTGKLQQNQRNDLLKAAQTLSSVMKKGIQRSYEKMQGEVSTIPGASSLVEKRTPDIQKRKKQTQAKMAEIEQIAKKQFGPDKESYNRYIKMKRQELGL